MHQPSRQELSRRARADYGIYLESGGSTVNDRISAFDARLEVVRAILETNLIGPFALSQGIIALMRDQGHGRVVSVTSAMGQLCDMGGGAPGFRLAAVGINGMTKMFAEELRGTDVLVNSVDPGWVRTRSPDATYRRRCCYNGLACHSSKWWAIGSILPRQATAPLVTSRAILRLTAVPTHRDVLLGPRSMPATGGHRASSVARERPVSTLSGLSPFASPRPSNGEKFTNASERGSQFESPLLRQFLPVSYLKSID